MHNLAILRPRFSLKFSVTGLLVVLAFGFRIGSPFLADLSYLFLGLLALLGRRQAVIALALSWFFTMLNPGLVPEASFGAVGRYFVIVAAAVSVLLRAKTKSQTAPQGLIWSTWLLAIFIFTHSLTVSPFVDVSLLKLFSWLTVFLTLLSAWGGLLQEARTSLASQLFWSFAVLALLSVPLFFLPVGYLRNGSGFQGLLSHPQAFGLSMAFLATWASARMLSVKRKWYWTLLVFLLAVFLTIVSEARTAGVALVFAIFVSLALVRLTSKKRMKLLFPAFQSKNFSFFVLGAVLVLLVLAPKIAEVANKFLTKSGRADVSDLISAFKLSRGVLYLPMLENIASAPWKGIGYGVPSDPQSLAVQRDPLFGLPVSAPVEKGVMPLAILEELGILGFGIFVLWLLIMCRYAIKGGVTGLAIILVVLLVNLGEAMLFSPGGMGLLAILLSTYAVVCGSSERYEAEHSE